MVNTGTSFNTNARKPTLFTPCALYFHNVDNSTQNKLLTLKFKNMKTKNFNSEILLTCVTLFVTNITLATFFAVNSNYIITVLFTGFAVVFGIVALEEIKPTLQVIIRLVRMKTKQIIKPYTRTTKAITCYIILVVLLPVWCFKEGLTWRKTEGFLYGVRSVVVLSIHPNTYIKNY